MDILFEQKLDELYNHNRHQEIVDIIEQILEIDWDWKFIGYYIAALNNTNQSFRAVEVSLRYKEQGEKDPKWHYRLGYAYADLGCNYDAEFALQTAKELADEQDNNIVSKWVDELLSGWREYSNAEIAWHQKPKKTKEEKVLKARKEANRRAAKIPRNYNKSPFEDFDFSEFWDDSDYAKKEYVGVDATDEHFNEAEKLLGYKLPESYKWLMKQHNGGIPHNTCHPTESRTSWSENHIAIHGIVGVDPEKTYSLIETNELMIEEWGYPNIGVAICDCPSAGHDMIFLDYRYCGKDGEPEVVHIDQECDYEITYVADSFESFIRGLINNDKFDEEPC